MYRVMALLKKNIYLNNICKRVLRLRMKELLRNQTWSRSTSHLIRQTIDYRNCYFNTNQGDEDFKVIEINNLCF